MSTANREIVARGLVTVRRSAVWWAVAVNVFVVLNMAFWPSLRDSDALTELEASTGDLLEAFGAGGIATPGGYLDGQVFALMLPLLLSGMALALATSLTAGDEDAGRLAVLHALPVSRPAVWLGRLLAVAVALVAVTVVTSLTVLVSLALFDLDVPMGRVVVASIGCGLLAAFHAAVGYAAGAAGLARGRAVAVGVVVLVVGYLVSSVLPLADALEPAQQLSPWYWAVRTQPVTQGVAPWGWVALVVTTAAVVVLGTELIRRRDIRAP